MTLGKVLPVTNRGFHHFARTQLLNRVQVSVEGSEMVRLSK